MPFNLIDVDFFPHCVDSSISLREPHEETVLSKSLRFQAVVGILFCSNSIVWPWSTLLVLSDLISFSCHFVLWFVVSPSSVSSHVSLRHAPCIPCLLTLKTSTFSFWTFMSLFVIIRKLSKFMRSI
jgi:hypothetical protein